MTRTMAIEKDILDQLLAGRDPQEIFSRDGLVDELKKALSERILNAELEEQLVGERQAGRSNRRNGSSQPLHNEETDTVWYKVAGFCEAEADEVAGAQFLSDLRELSRKPPARAVCSGWGWTC